MKEFFENFLLAWIPLFVAMDPVGLVPIFLGITEKMTPQQRKMVSFQATLTAAIVVVGFMFLGKFMFRALGITVADFQMAGGLILLVIAGVDLVGMEKNTLPAADDSGVVPLGMPLIAGPATISTLLILIDSIGYYYTLLGLMVNLAMVAMAFALSERLTRWFGVRGMRAASKIVSMLLAAIAVNMIRRGWQAI
jgi:multiple antibiotic resistance protein